MLCASVRCGHSAEEVNKAWSQISQHCPLLLVSTVVTLVLHTAHKLNELFKHHFLEPHAAICLFLCCVKTHSTTILRKMKLQWQLFLL